jgi:hypothetical protein
VKQRLLKLSSTQLFLPCILLLAAVLFVIGYNFSVPILSKDEGWLLGIILEQRGLGDVTDLPGYPPVILFVFSTATKLVELTTDGNLFAHTGEIIILIRLSHVLVNLLSLLFIFRLTQLLSNSFAALFAAFIWALAPGIFEHIRLALSEAWLLMFITGSMCFMMETLEKKRAWLAIVSTVLGLLAVATKYNVAPVLAFGLAAVGFLAWKDNKSWFQVFGLQILLILAWAFLLLFVYGAIGILDSGRPTASSFLDSGIAKIIDFSLIQRVFLESAQVLSINPNLALVLLVSGGVFYLKKATLPQRIVWLLMLLFAIITTWFVASYLIHDGIADRYVAAASSTWLVLIVVSTTAIIQLIPRNLYGYLAQSVFVLILLGFWFVPMLQDRILSIQTLLRIDTRLSVSEWSSSSLPRGTIALDGQHWFIFDPIWGGYHGPLRPWVARERWLERPLEEWLMAEIRYVQINGTYPGDTSILPFDNIYHLKSFPIPEQEERWTGDSFHIYRIVSDNFVEVDLAFENGISLAAYELSGREFTVGETLAWLPYWAASQRPAYDYQVFLHLVPLDTFVPVAQLDINPAIRPSTSWDDDYETVIGNLFQLSIPQELEAGRYRLIVGLYRPDNFERVETVEGMDYLEIGEISIRN